VTISWPTATSVDVIRGDLSGTPIAPATGVLKPTPPVASSTFTGTVIQCLLTNSPVISGTPDASAPGANNGFYYLVRGQTVNFCNQTGPPAFTTNSPKEKVGRDAQISADPTPCP
jgi:hypothetical protein